MGGSFPPFPHPSAALRSDWAAAHAAAVGESPTRPVVPCPPDVLSRPAPRNTRATDGGGPCPLPSAPFKRGIGGGGGGTPPPRPLRWYEFLEAPKKNF